MNKLLLAMLGLATVNSVMQGDMGNQNQEEEEYEEQ